MRWIIGTILIGLGALLFCEYLADFVYLRKCKWPKLNRQRYIEDPLQALILSDPHLAGPHINGWLDRTYTEWHIKRAFQASVKLLKPDVVFILGDLFDEGDKLNNQQFHEHMIRYLKIFNLPPGIPLISVAGNHDVGFHFKLHPYYLKRFEENFNNSLVHLYSIKDVHFVLINSMALGTDGCTFCEMAETALRNVSQTLYCMKDPQEEECSDAADSTQSYSQPILLQHIPTYRISDDICIEHDAPYMENFRENVDVLSKNLTEMLGDWLKPRLAFAGHSHHYCRSVNRLGINEFTVASFCWRKKDYPSFLMATITPNDYKVAKCQILPKQFVYNCYYSAGALLLLLTAYKFVLCLVKSRRQAQDEEPKDS
ncbi:metallophosphoesterase 1 homolog [Drosophila tropicalis]|uniref:metallophosphoesterase 1 homolog n=1 Tax=Drosophila tropicalis TaxID=46794 RepID=UPI0035AB87F1